MVNDPGVVAANAQSYNDLRDLMEAAYHGDYDRLEIALDPKGPKPFLGLVRPDMGSINDHLTNVNALHAAAMAGQYECVELLIEKRADPHVRTMMDTDDLEDGKTALDYAMDEGYDDIVELLTKAQKEIPKGIYLPRHMVANGWRMGDDVHGLADKIEAFQKAKQERLRKERQERKDGKQAAERERREKHLQKARMGETIPAADPGVQVSAASPAAPPQNSYANFPVVPSGVPEGKLPVALLFPGQGSQYVGMMKECKDIPTVKIMLSQAKDILGYDLVDLFLNGPESRIEETIYCQPVMYVSSLAAVQKLASSQKDVVQRCMAVAGLSLGEYTALTVAGVLTFEQGLKLVKIRAEGMAAAGRAGNQQMVSIAGLEEDVLRNICTEASSTSGSGEKVSIANMLFPKGFACSGSKGAVKKLMDLATEKGALQVKAIKAGGAFHTDFMAPAREQLREALKEALPSMKPPRCSVYFNVNGKGCPAGTEPAKLIELLEDQLTSPVMWHKQMDQMISDGVEEFYEVGPMKQLKAMMKRINPEVWKKTVNIEV